MGYCSMLRTCALINLRHLWEPHLTPAMQNPIQVYS